MFDKNIFGSRVKKLRISSKITQQELADIISLKKTAISMIESGSRAASIEIICSLADYFQVSIDYLVGRTEDPTLH